MTRGNDGVGVAPTIPLLTLLAGVLILALTVMAVASRSAPEGSPAPTPSEAPVASSGGDTSTTIGMRPASIGAAAAALDPAATPEPAGHIYARDGYISHMGEGYARTYLALPCKHGNVRCDLTVRLCGPADCVTLRQTDYGPSQRLHPDRIADVSIAMFERLCGVPAGMGLCNGSWTAVVALPETDTEEAP